MNIVGKVKDRPSLALLISGVLVAAHWSLIRAGVPLPDPTDVLEKNLAIALAIYIGLAGVVAIIAGFAGVVVTFALGQQTTTFVRLRQYGGPALRANWVAPIATSFSAAFGVFVCAIAAVLSWHALAWWLFEFFFLTAASAAVRLVWLFKALAGLVDQDDEETLQRLEQEREVDVFDPHRP